jgi:hypothetical protein
VKIPTNESPTTADASIHSASQFINPATIKEDEISFGAYNTADYICNDEYCRISRFLTNSMPQFISFFITGLFS